METKVCIVCKETKPIMGFQLTSYKNSRGEKVEYRRNQCYICYNTLLRNSKKKKRKEPLKVNKNKILMKDSGKLTFEEFLKKTMED